jgi:hypothetical protein
LQHGTALYDKEYHTGSEFDMAEKLGIEVMVAIPATSGSSQEQNPAYNMENFPYDEQSDTFTWTQGQLMNTNGNWHKAKSGAMFQQYKTRQCNHCVVRPKYTKSKENVKVIQLGEYAQNIGDYKQRVENNPQTYKPYGLTKFLKQNIERFFIRPVKRLIFELLLIKSQSF